MGQDRVHPYGGVPKWLRERSAKPARESLTQNDQEIREAI
jgi:hypothetical protein